MTQKKQIISSFTPFKVLTSPIYKNSATAFCYDGGTYIYPVRYCWFRHPLMVVLLFFAQRMLTMQHLRAGH